MNSDFSTSIDYRIIKNKFLIYRPPITYDLRYKDQFDCRCKLDHPRAHFCSRKIMINKGKSSDQWKSNFNTMKKSFENQEIMIDDQKSSSSSRRSSSNCLDVLALNSGVVVRGTYDLQQGKNSNFCSTSSSSISDFSDNNVNDFWCKSLERIKEDSSSSSSYCNSNLSAILAKSQADSKARIKLFDDDDRRFLHFKMLESKPPPQAKENNRIKVFHAKQLDDLIDDLKLTKKIFNQQKLNNIQQLKLDHQNLESHYSTLPMSPKSPFGSRKGPLKELLFDFEDKFPKYSSPDDFSYKCSSSTLNNRNDSSVSVHTTAQICLSSPSNQHKSASATVFSLSSSIIVPPIVTTSSVVASSSEQVSTTTKTCSVEISTKLMLPRFYFPHGSFGNSSSVNLHKQIAQTVENVKRLFAQNHRAHVDQIGQICKECKLPTFLRRPLLKACVHKKNRDFMTFEDFEIFWPKFANEWQTDNAKLIRLLASNDSDTLKAEDFIVIIQDIVDNHVGLVFLRQAPDFHSRYIQTVITRIFYTINRSWSGEITLEELNKSNLFETLKKLDQVDDINLVTDYFSYEHFYVVYCKFWELDKDHDLSIDKHDLARHNDYAISERIIDRIFSGAVTRKGALKNSRMSYTDFIWFLLSEEDKRTPTSIEYWFRCMDIDGDGYLSMYELEYFYEDQAHKMSMMGIEPMPFNDVLCQMLDILKPTQNGCISLRDLKRSKMTSVFFDTFINVEKYLEHEQKESGAFSIKFDLNDDGSPTISDWDRFASQEYEALVAEEQQLQQQNDDQQGKEPSGIEIHCDESDDEELLDTNEDICSPLKIEKSIDDKIDYDPILINNERTSNTFVNVNRRSCGFKTYL
uniref:EF-hand domain-containing protein n=1 Tax=Romanomermis culicivorax TaxID=13658 RepID=A0A915ITF2_ROMCU